MPSIDDRNHANTLNIIERENNKEVTDFLCAVSNKLGKLAGESGIPTLVIEQVRAQWIIGARVEYSLQHKSLL